MPLFFFVGVTLRIAQVVMKLSNRWGNNQLAGILFVGYLIFIAACVGAWKRYLAVHPDGPPDPPPTRIENDARPEA
jgi:hypothetical protein